MHTPNTRVHIKKMAIRRAQNRALSFHAAVQTMDPLCPDGAIMHGQPNGLLRTYLGQAACPVISMGVCVCFCVMDAFVDG